MRVERICPAYADGECRKEHHQVAGKCVTFRCSECKRIVPWCYGGSEDNRCNACWALSCERDEDPRAYVS